MSRSAKILLGLVLTLIVAGLIWLSTAIGGERSHERGSRRVSSIGSATAESATPAALPRDTVPLEETYEPLETPVVHPVWVELSLMRAMGEVQAEGADPRGTGASAKLLGSVTGTGGKPVRAVIEFVAGTNTGRKLEADLTGAFGAVDLYPGPAVVRISGPGIPGAERELRLRQRKQVRLHIAFARPTAVYGQVVDQKGTAITGATVRLDGQEILTDAEGEFYVSRVAPGPALCFVHKSGYARHREVLSLSVGRTVPRGKLKLVLAPGADLTLSFRNPVGARGPAKVFLFPADWRAFSNSKGQRTYPWHLVSPVDLYPSGTTVIEDLPAGRLNLRVFHNGSSSRLNAVHLRAGKKNTHAFQIAPSPMLEGHVTLDGNPVARARVTLEAPDRVAATLRSFGEPLQFLETAVFPFPPTAVQEIETDSRGRFALSPWYEVVGTRYVTAESRDGQYRDARVLRKGEYEIELKLEEAVGNDGLLSVGFSPRQHPLPIRLLIDGEPRDPFAVPVGEPLEVVGLQPGVWRVRVHWRADVLIDDQDIDLRPRGELFVKLPEGAVVGQTLEERIRSGVEPRPRDKRFR